MPNETLLSAIRVLRRERGLASCKGKGQAFREAYDNTRLLQRLSSHPAPPIASTYEVKNLPTPLITTACPKSKTTASFKQAYHQARMRKLERVLERAQKSNRPTPMMTSATPTKSPSPLGFEKMRSR
jgi:hypothetical protein